MRITLTDKQIRQLVPFYDRVQATAVSGHPGMLVGQIRRNNEGDWWMEPGFLNHEHAKLITEKGQDVVRSAPPPGAPVTSSTVGEQP